MISHAIQTLNTLDPCCPRCRHGAATAKIGRWRLRRVGWWGGRGSNPRPRDYEDSVNRSIYLDVSLNVLVNPIVAFRFL